MTTKNAKHAANKKLKIQKNKITNYFSVAKIKTLDTNKLQKMIAPTNQYPFFLNAFFFTSFIELFDSSDSLAFRDSLFFCIEILS